MHIYFKDHTEYGDLMLFTEFENMVEHGAITPDDGDGFWATLNKTSNLRLVPKHGMLEAQRPAWATHVMWYNK